MTTEKNVRRIIIASPNTSFAEQLKTHLERQDFKVIEIVVVLEHLIESLELLNSEGERVDGIIFTSDLGKKLDDKRLELLSDVLLTIRERYSEINIVALANEVQGHPFLAELVNMGIYNIFIKGSDFNIPALISTFEKPISFAEAAKYRNFDPKIPWRREFRSGGHSLTINLVKNGLEMAPSDAPDPQQISQPKEREKETVIKEKTVEITISKYLAIPSKIISVVSLYPQTGSTFLIDNFSTYLSNNNLPVGIIETASKSPVWVELLGEEKMPPEWEPWVSQIKENGYVKKGTEWKDENIYYVPIGKEPVEGVTDEDALKLFYLTKQIPLLFVDVSHDINNPISKVALQQSDEIWIVLSGDPVQINVNVEKVTNYINEINQGQSTVMIGNKWSKTLDEYLSPEIVKERTGIPLVTTMPEMSDTNLTSMWERKKAVQTTKGIAQLENPFKELANRILPVEITKGFTHKKNWLKLFGK